MSEMRGHQTLPVGGLPGFPRDIGRTRESWPLVNPPEAIGPSSAPDVTPDQFDRAFSASAARGLDQDFIDTITQRLTIRPEQIRVTPADSTFGHELLDPQVRAATARHRLVRWWLQGRDLVFVRHSQMSSPTAENALGVVRTLVELANAFPPGVAQRHGTAPTTDLPLR